MHRMAAAVLLAAVCSAVGAAEVKGLSTIALQSVLEELVPAFEKANGHKVTVTFGLGMPLVKRVQDGESADFLLAPRGGIDGLIKAGKIAAVSDATLARSSVAVAVRKGAPRPDISTPDALKRALLDAKAISYSNPAFGGASGVHFAKVLERLGIADAMKAKTRFPEEGGFTARLLVAGEVDMAVQQMGELLSVPGAELLGPLPGDLQSVTTFAIAVPAAASQPDAARAFIRYLRSPQAAAVMKAKGLDPVEDPR